MKRVLVVEDEAIVGQHIKLSLKNHGFEVPYVTKSGEEAIEILEKETFDLIYMDINLGGILDGIETATIIGNKYSIPIVYLTAYNNIELIERAKKTNPYGYLVKPFEDIDLRTTSVIAIHKAETERELNETQQWLSSIITNMDEGVAVLDSEGRIMFYNEPAMNILDVTDNQLIGKYFLDTIPFENEKQKMEVFEIFISIAVEGKFVRNQSNPYRLRLKSKEIALDITASLMGKSLNEKAGIVVVFRDITKIEKMNQSLKQSEERLRSIIESASDGLVLLDEKGNIVEFNPGAESILNESYDVVNGQPLWRIFPELLRDDSVHYEDSGSLGRQVLSVIKDENKLIDFPEKEKNFRRSDGIWKRLKIRMFTTRTSHQTYLGISIKDLSDTSLTRIQFLKDNDRFNSSFEDYPAPLFLSDGFAHSFLLNNSAWRLLGYSGPIKTLSEVELFGKIKPMTKRLEDLKKLKILDYQNIILMTSKRRKRESLITIIAQFDLENNLSGLRGLVH